MSTKDQMESSTCRSENLFSEICKTFLRMCGHREYDSDFLDKRAFGFPFDRNLNFELDDNKRYNNCKTVILNELNV